jgi:hypothetical protein
MIAHPILKREDVILNATRTKTQPMARMTAITAIGIKSPKFSITFSPVNQ